MTPPFTLPRCLCDADETSAIGLLRSYFPVDGPGYPGGAFDTFDPSGTRDSSTDIFTADDLLSVSLLSVELSGRAILHMFRDRQDDLTNALRKVPSELDLVDLESVAEADFPAWGLWRTLMSIPDVGSTTASKLMARKRPRLIPIFDTVINAYVLGGSGELWAPLHAELRADGRRLHRKLLELRTAAGVDTRVSALRVFDVLAWMEGRPTVR